MKKELMLELLNTKQYKQLHTLLMENNAVDIAYLLQQIEIDDCAIAFRLLSKKKAAQVFSNMDIKMQSQLVELFSEKELESLIENQYMDDLVDLIEELPANLVTRLLKHVDENQRQVINQLLSYPKDSAGTIMTTEFLSLKKETQLEDALNYIKQNGNHCKSIYTSYVCQDKKLIGIVSTKDILLNDENKSIEEIMKEDFQYVYTHTDQEEVVNIFRKYDLVVLPVLDDEKMLVGIVTVDDVMDVMVDETSEDISKMAAVEPHDKSYFETSVFEHAKHRIIWLLVLMFSATLTGSIITRYENAFQAVPLLVSFIPMLMDTGGNAGSQASVTVIRGLSLNEIEYRDVPKVVFKEIRVALICGITLSAANFVKLLLLDKVGVLVAASVCLTLVAAVVIAMIIGCLLPILAKRLGFDPAVMASPFITTIVDAMSLLVYFRVASAILGL